MQNQLLLTIAAIGVAAAGMGVGTFAYFSDTGNSAGNTIGPAATVTLALNGDDTPDGAAAFFSASNCLPGDLCGAGELTSTNVGTAPDANLTLDYDVDYTETVAGLAAQLKVVKFNLDGVDQFAAGGCFASLSDPDLADIAAAGTTCISATDAFDPDQTLGIEFELRTGAGNEFQGASATINVDVLLRQDIDPTSIAA